MAYPTPTLNRITYDKDGTGVYHSKISTGALTTATAQNIADLNSEKNAITWDRVGGNGGSRVCFAFPTNRDITGWFVHFGCNPQAGANDVAPHMETSTDTTDTINGTWTTVPGITGTPFANANTLTGSYTNPLAIPYFRDTPGPYTLPTPLTNVKFLRFWIADTLNWGVYWNHIHLFGKPTTVTDRIDLWHPTVDAPLSDYPGFFDWSDSPRSSSLAARSFRVKNRSTGLSASGIVIAATSLNGLSPTLESGTQFRYNAGAYAATATVPGPLAPGAISALIDVKVDVPATMALGLTTQRYGTTVGAWA